MQAAGAQSCLAVGAGVDVRFESDDMTGGALAAADARIHLAAFAVRNRKPEGTPICRSIHRTASGYTVEQAVRTSV